MSKPFSHRAAPRVALPEDAVRVAKASAAGTKTDFKSLLASSLSESRHDPAARNKRSTAAGAFQFTERTWLGLVHKYGAALGQGDAAAQITVQGGKPSGAHPTDRAALLER